MQPTLHFILMIMLDLAPDLRGLCFMQEDLVQELKAVFLRLSQAKVSHQTTVAKKERNAARYVS